MSETPTELRARVLNCAGRLAQMQGDYGATRIFHEQAMAIQKLIDDEAGLCRSLEKLMPALNNLAIVNRAGRVNMRARQRLYYESADIARTTDAEKPLSHALHGLAEVRMTADDYAAALPLFRESLSLRQRLGNRPEMVNTLARWQ